MLVKPLNGGIRIATKKSRSKQIILPSKKGLHSVIKNWPTRVERNSNVNWVEGTACEVGGSAAEKIMLYVA